MFAKPNCVSWLSPDDFFAAIKPSRGDVFRLLIFKAGGGIFCTTFTNMQIRAHQQHVDPPPAPYAASFD